MIEKVVRFRIACDTADCGEEYDWQLFDNQSQAVRQIRDNGWGVYRRHGKIESVACPTHNDFDNGN
jgi:hypothetical protein